LSVILSKVLHTEVEKITAHGFHNKYQQAIEKITAHGFHNKYQQAIELLGPTA